ncbi:MAG: hypothetical protein IPP94_11895 [Ignavibacteria bacterium]|nr:hypothetical protein [Ignavibacteria bacterium]
MQRWCLFLFAIFLCADVHAQSRDFIWVDTHGDTAVVWDRAREVNCAARFAFDVKLDGGTFTITQRDTVAQKANCLCEFGLRTTIGALVPGHYIVNVYREFLVQFGYPADTTVFIGSVSFGINAPPSGPPSVTGWQSPCDALSWIPELEFPRDVGFKLFPVPVRNSAVMTFDTSWVGHVTVSICDERGRRMLTAFDGMYYGELPKYLEFSTASLPASGMYHVLVETPGRVLSRLLPVLK